MNQNYPIKKLIYSGEHKREISMPMGGIGTGCIGLASNGSLVDFEIFNRPNKMSNNGFTFFAVKAEKNGKICDIRALQTDAKITHTGFDRMPGTAFHSNIGYGPDRTTLGGFPHFPESDFVASYPFGEIDFSYEKFPGKIHLNAWNPLIPLNDTDSSIPAAFMEYEITNDTDETVDYTFYGILNNPWNFSVNSFSESRNDKIKYIKLTSCNESFKKHEKGEMCIGVYGDNVRYQEYMFRGAWFDNLQTLWNNMHEGELVNRTYEPEGGRKDSAVISTKLTLAPGEKDKVRFVISWYMPLAMNFWDSLKPSAEEIDPQTHSQEQILEIQNQYYEKNLWKNYYTRYFTGADECVYYCLSQWERLYEETDMYRQLLFSSTLPKDVLDAVSANVSILKSPTCLRNYDGSFYAFEGCSRDTGSCQGTCTHVWNYAYALPYLFPSLERSIRNNHYKYDMDDIGGLAFRTTMPLGRPHSSERSFACADGQFGDVLKVYREFKLSGNVEWLASIWKDVVKSIEYAWHPENAFKWDPDKTGHLSGRQHHTLDMELFSPNSWLDGFYVAALKAAAEMAVVMKDKKHAEEFNALYEKGREYLNKELFNGRYFIQNIDVSDSSYILPFTDEYTIFRNHGNVYKSYWNEETNELKYQIGEGCSVDQVLAQWHCDIIGLGEVFDRDKTKSALKTIYQENFKSMRDFFNPCRLYCLDDEKGVIICTYPEGAKKPKIPVPYAEECMNGFEYQAASHMIMNGMTREGLEIVHEIRKRYDGTTRNPFNEMECGSNYARSMASYTLLGALCGQTIDRYNKYYKFCPDMDFAEKGVFRCMVCFEGFLGYVERGVDYIQLKCLKGSIKVRKIEVPDVPLKVKCNNLEIGHIAEGNTAILDNDCEVNPERDLLVIFKTN